MQVLVDRFVQNHCNLISIKVHRIFLRAPHISREKMKFYIGRLRNPRRQGVSRIIIRDGDIPELLEEAKEDMSNKHLLNEGQSRPPRSMNTV